MKTIPYSTQFIDEYDLQNVIEALKAPMLTQGDKNEIFEYMLAEYLGVKYVLTFNSATSALYAAYNACFEKGSRVITTPISFVARANMLLACGCEPVFVDIGYDGNINPESIQAMLEKASRNTSTSIQGIVSVDFGGNSVDITAISALVKQYGLKFISDSSHAFGGNVNGQKIGSFADASIFSFHAIKPITTAEGGAISTNNKEIYEKAKLIRSHGLVKQGLWESEVTEIGFNFRLNEMQAALGMSQLNKIDMFLHRRENIARIYDKFFANNPYFTPIHPMIPPSHKSTNHLYPILLNQEFVPHKEKIFHLLLARDLGVQVHYKPIFNYKIFAPCEKDSGSNAIHWYEAEISLPCHQAMSDKEVAYCIQTTLKTFEEVAKSGIKAIKS